MSRQPGADPQQRQARALRDRLTDRLLADGAIVSPAVEAAFRTVPRHMFVPEVSLPEAYAKEVVVTKRQDGIVVSSVSAPDIQAIMLEQADLRPGMRCLEIGSGGYNAALMAEIVGPSGRITSIDIDPDVVARARACLAQAGWPQVEVVCWDAEQEYPEQEYPEQARYDRIVVTAAAWDLPPAWSAQLAPGGSVTVPLRIHGLTRSLNFVREGDHLIARSSVPCGFVAIRGAGSHRERCVGIDGDEISLVFDEEPPPAPDFSSDILDRSGPRIWTGVRSDSFRAFEGLQLWLAGLEGFGLLSTDPVLDTAPLVPVTSPLCPAIARSDSFAYLTARQISGVAFEFGAHGFGPHAGQLAEVLAESVRRWDRAHRDGPGPQIAAYPASTGPAITDPASTDPARHPAGVVVTKRHSRIVITWP